MTVNELPRAVTRAVGNLPILAAISLLVVGIGIGVGITAAFKEQATLRGVKVITCGEAPQCPPTDDRVVLGLWTDGELRLSKYTADGWVDSRLTRVFNGGYVTSWRELP